MISAALVAAERTNWNQIRSSDICVPERDFIQAAHIFFLPVCSGHERNCIAVFLVNQIRMYLSSQSQMLYLI